MELLRKRFKFSAPNTSKLAYFDLNDDTTKLNFFLYRFVNGRQTLREKISPVEFEKLLIENDGKTTEEVLGKDLVFVCMPEKQKILKGQNALFDKKPRNRTVKKKGGFWNWLKNDLNKFFNR